MTALIGYSHTTQKTHSKSCRMFTPHKEVDRSVGSVFGFEFEEALYSERTGVRSRGISSGLPFCLFGAPCELLDEWSDNR
jgi:hypothetical protein